MAMNETKSLEAKLVLLGDSGVGKTSVAIRFVQGVFSEDQPSTIGASFFTKRMVFGEWKLKAQIWDTAGQERFKSMAPMYYRGAQGAIVMYDITNEASFNSVKGWITELRSSVSSDLVIAIVGNKADRQERVIQTQRAQQFANESGCIFFETSAKDGQGTAEMFTRVAEQVVENHKKHNPNNSQQSGQSAGSKSPNQKQNIFLTVADRGKTNCNC